MGAIPRCASRGRHCAETVIDTTFTSPEFINSGSVKLKGPETPFTLNQMMERRRFRDMPRSSTASGTRRA